MGLDLRQYQSAINNAVQVAWDHGNRNVLMVLPTGGGKTVCLSDIVNKEPGAVCVIAHRQELVSQISMALAKNGIVHKIIASKKVVKMIISMQVEALGRTFYNYQSHVAVAGVDTLTKRHDELAHWLPTVKLWIIDEAHHVLTANKWGTAVEMFPNARGLGVTATPLRADGKGLGADNDGEFHEMVVGPSMRELIDMKFLTEYRIFAPVNNINMDNARVSKATGDWNKNDVSSAVAKSSLVVHDKSTVVGDVVKHYLKIAKGKLGITFVPDMDTGREIEAQFNAVGVRAKLINAKTPDDERAMISRQFENHEYKQLINVDIFGEGYDLPALEVVSFARPTQSYGLYVQMFGRVLRILTGKKYGIIIDHVGNVARHGLPDAPRVWSLERRGKRSHDDDVMPVKTCPSCTFVYERFKKACPNCGVVPTPADRGSIEYVDGDLTELSPEVLTAMRSQIDVVDSPIEDQVIEYRRQLQLKHTKEMYVKAHCNRMAAKLQAQQDGQKVLRHFMAWWAGYRRSEGLTDDEIFKMFYLKYKVDWVTAQTLPGDEAHLLTKRIGDPK